MMQSITPEDRAAWAEQEAAMCAFNQSRHDVEAAAERRSQITIEEACRKDGWPLLEHRYHHTALRNQNGIGGRIGIAAVAIVLALAACGLGAVLWH